MQNPGIYFGGYIRGRFLRQSSVQVWVKSDFHRFKTPSNLKLISDLIEIWILALSMPIHFKSHLKLFIWLADRLTDLHFKSYSNLNNHLYDRLTEWSLLHILFKTESIFSRQIDWSLLNFLFKTEFCFSAPQIKLRNLWIVFKTFKFISNMTQVCFIPVGWVKFWFCPPLCLLLLRDPTRRKVPKLGTWETKVSLVCHFVTLQEVDEKWVTWFSNCSIYKFWS